MGTVIACSVITFIILTVSTALSKDRLSKKDWIEALFNYTLCGIILGAIIGSVLAAGISEQLVVSSNPPDMNEYIVNTNNLLEAHPGTYVTTEIQSGVPKLVVRTGEELLYIDWSAATVEFSSDKAYLIEYNFSWENKLLNFFLFEPVKTKYKIYTPQAELEDIYKLITER